MSFEWTKKTRLPNPGDDTWATLGLERWLDSAQSLEPATADAVRHLAEDTEFKDVLAAVFGNSPFLTQCMTSAPAFVLDLLSKGPDDTYNEVMQGFDAARKRALDEKALMHFLRVAKRKIALTIALADIAAIWSFERIIQALSDFADSAISLASAYVISELARRGCLTLNDDTDPESGSGYIVLALGKLGARELNYSSDVDLIVLFDTDRIRTDEPEELQRHFIRATRNLVRLLEERTNDGYVFRVDLRLRPDPSSTPLALSVIAAETYYESLGQNWERAAMIKARPVAGDLEAGSVFLNRLKPYVWRKNLDFAAIQDIHSIKRQIHAHKGGGTIAVAGHNIKLGRGGIREIEFFAQTQQLIWGGRVAELRGPRTLDSLNALCQQHKIERETAEELRDSYIFLRTLEHRLQMINDEQTQILPKDPDARNRVAAFMGFDDLDAFEGAVIHHLRRVEHHYAHLFEDSPELSIGRSETGNLVFTGGEADPDTIRTINELGYTNAHAVDSAIRGWHHGRYRATRSVRSRELLTELVPNLLSAFAATPNPDHAFLKFDEFLSRLPAGVQLFSMFYANPHLLELLAEILGEAPRLAAHLSAHPNVLESVLSGDFFEPLPAIESMCEELDKVLLDAKVLEDTLDLCRRWVHDRQFQIGVQILRGFLSPQEASAGLSAIADAALMRLLPHVETDFARRHGFFPGSGLAVVAMGKLGSQEMTPTSDLDLIFVYTTPDGVESSDGDRPLVPSQYFARLSQRFINAITAQTAEGTLYEVDMRLRPSGNAGPIASNLDAFIQYHDDLAWTWEHMALNRARVVAGPPELKTRIETVIEDVLSRPRDADALLKDVASMRRRMDAEHHTDCVWNIKHYRGGMVDIEFLVQYLQLRHAHETPHILARSTEQALHNLAKGAILDHETAAFLVETLNFWHALQMALRVTIEGSMTDERENEISPALRNVLIDVGHAVDFGDLKDKIRETASRVHAIFNTHVDTPAQQRNLLDE